MEKSEIIAARLGGLGSSDAKMVASVGRNKALTKTATDRISVMMGMEEKKQFSTEATAKGDYIESAVFWMKNDEIEPNFKTIISTNSAFKTHTQQSNEITR